MSKSAKLYYVHDPMCSWCWAFKPCWEAMKAQLYSEFPDSLSIEALVGGLAKDTDATMPTEQQATINQTWRTIKAQLGTEFNFDFWSQNTPRRSTYMSCRAVLAAESQQQGAGDVMIQRIQEAYYLRALNPSDTETLVQLAAEVGLDQQVFESELPSRALQVRLRNHFRLARRLPIQGFPSLVLARPANNSLLGIPATPEEVLLAMDAEQLRTDFIAINYSNPQPMMEQIRMFCRSLLQE